MKDLSRCTSRTVSWRTSAPSRCSYLVRRTHRSTLGCSQNLPDTSEYPRSALFGHTEDNVSSRLQEVINDLADEAPRPLGEAIARFAASVARVVAKSRKDDTESESGGSDGYDAFEDYDDVGTAPESTLDMVSLQQYVFMGFGLMGY